MVKKLRRMLGICDHKWKNGYTKKAKLAYSHCNKCDIVVIDMETEDKNGIHFNNENRRKPSGL